MAGLMKNVLSNRNTEFSLDEVRIRCLIIDEPMDT